MPKSVLIILAAVVVLIAVVVILGLRYLRSDDEEYDDAAATGPGRDRDMPRRRREHDDFDAERDLPRPVARSTAGRDARAAGPRRDARSARGDYQGDDRTELLPAGARASRTRATRTTPAVREVAVAKDQRDDVLPAVKPRQDKGKGKGKRDAVDWPSNEWDELSDVDYWTELAADKPFTADAPETARHGRPHRGSGHTDHAREADRSGRARGEDLTSTGPRPVSSARAERPDPLGPDPRGPETRRPGTKRMEPATSRHAASLDDDPLTSPSFPRIDANDSRTYRRSRSGSHERPAPRAEYAAAPTSNDQPAGTYARPAADGYPPASHDLPVPDSYLMPAWNGASRHGAAAPSADYDYGSSRNGSGHSGSGQYSVQPDGASQYGASQYGASQYGASQYGAGYYEPAQYGAASAGYGAARYDQLRGYGTGAYDFGAGGHGSDPPGYNGNGYGSQAAGSYDSLPAGYTGQHHAEPGYPDQPGGPGSYSPSVAPTAAYLYQPPSPQPGHPGDLGDYAGADPYAVDPYGYGNNGY